MCGEPRGNGRLVHSLGRATANARGPKGRREDSAAPTKSQKSSVVTQVAYGLPPAVAAAIAHAQRAPRCCCVPAGFGPPTHASQPKLHGVVVGRCRRHRRRWRCGPAIREPRHRLLERGDLVAETLYLPLQPPPSPPSVSIFCPTCIWYGTFS